MVKERILLWRMGLSFLCLACLIKIQDAYAEVIVDTAAPMHTIPQIDMQNSVPIINIANPNPAGISLNRFQRFDIDGRGVILNNSINATSSALAGQVVGNHLLTSPASHIINQVKSEAHIKGAIEIVGPAAQVTIASPYGISVDNGEFINTKGVTLNTGNIDLNHHNEIIRHTSPGSQISIGTGGLRADSDTKLYSSKITNEGEVIAFGQLHLQTGVYDLNTQSGALTKIDANAGAGLALSGSGGYQAEHIQIIANEKGLGVNLERLNALSGDIQISSSGVVTVGETQAAKNIHINSAELINIKAMRAGQDIKLSAQRLHNNQGNIEAKHNTNILVSTFDNEAGKISALNDVNIKADKLINHRGAIQKKTRFQYENSQDKHVFDQEIETTAPAEIIAGNNLVLNIGDGRNQASKLFAANNLSLTANSFANESDYLKIKDDFSYRLWKGKDKRIRHRVSDIHFSTQEEAAELTAGQTLQVKSNQFSNSGKVKAQNIFIESDQILNGIFNSEILTPIEPFSGGQISGGNIQITSSEMTNNGYIQGEMLFIDAKYLVNRKRFANYYAIEHGDGYWVEVKGQQVQPGGIISGSNHSSFKTIKLTDGGGKIIQNKVNQRDALSQLLGAQYFSIPTTDDLKYEMHHY